MKTKFLILSTTLLLSFSGSVLAQAPDDCLVLSSLFTEPAKAENYEAALPHYKELVAQCPNYHITTYQYGAKMFQYFIDKGDKAKVEDLIQLYKDRLQAFPEKTQEGEVLADIAQLKYDNSLGSKMDQFNAFDAAYKKDPSSFTSPKSLYTYFSLAVDLYDTKEKDLQEVFDLYDIVYSKLEKEEIDLAGKLTPLMDKQEAGTELTSKEDKYMAAYETNLKAYGQVKESVDGKLGILADCPNLVPLYEKDYEANKDNVEWIKSVSSRLDAKDCDGPFSNKLALRLHELEPSSQSAYLLAKQAEAEGKSGKALEYYNQAADLETDNTRKYKIYFGIAENYRKKNSYSSAKSYYNKALSVKPSSGISYLRIAQMYAESANSCGNTVFEKRAINWLAADMAEKAARVDASVSSSANAAASTYRQRAPQKADIFSADMAGKTVTFNCWVGGSVKVPNL